MPVIQPGTENRHQEFLAVASKGDVELLFLGDSITDMWRNRGKAVWDQVFAPLKAANFGIGRDRTQHILWRVQNGELEGFKAKCIVMMLGTNNINVNTPDEVVAGVKAVVGEIRQRQPQAKILLLAIFPRGATPDDRNRAPIKQVNDSLAKLDDGKSVFYMDIGGKFLQPDGTLTAEIMGDFLHPTEKGYQIWADAIIEKVKQLMGPMT